MRIAYISYEFPPDTGKGGIGTYVSQVAKAMASMAWDVHVFAGSDNRTSSEYVEGFHVHRTRCTDANEFRTKVVSSFKMEHSALAFDIIESPEINANAWEIKKLFPSIPLVVRLHGPGYLVENLKKKYVPLFAKLRFVLGSVRRMKFDPGYWRPYDRSVDTDYQFTLLANYITCPSEVMKEWVVKNWNIAPEKITVIPNIFLPPGALVNIPVFKEPQYKRIIFFGRLNVLKGLVNATKAMKKILNRHPSWKFRIIGDDGPGPTNKISMRNWMKFQLKKVMHQVEFIDGVPYEQLPGKITEGEIVLLPSLFESFSYTCAEAMAAGKAVIGSNNAGMAELVKNNQNGVLIDPYNYHEIEVALEKLMTDDSYRYHLSMQARESILKDPDAKRTAISFSAFYEKISNKQFVKN